MRITIYWSDNTILFVSVCGHPALSIDMLYDVKPISSILTRTNDHIDSMYTFVSMTLYQSITFTLSLSPSLSLCFSLTLSFLLSLSLALALSMFQSCASRSLVPSQFDVESWWKEAKVNKNPVPSPPLPPTPTATPTTKFIQKIQTNVMLNAYKFTWIMHAKISIHW